MGSEREVRGVVATASTPARRVVVVEGEGAWVFLDLGASTDCRLAPPEARRLALDLLRLARRVEGRAP